MARVDRLSLRLTLSHYQVAVDSVRASAALGESLAQRGGPAARGSAGTAQRAGAPLSRASAAEAGGEV